MNTLYVNVKNPIDSLLFSRRRYRHRKHSQVSHPSKGAQSSSPSLYCVLLIHTIPIHHIPSPSPSSIPIPPLPISNPLYNIKPSISNTSDCARIRTPSQPYSKRAALPRRKHKHKPKQRSLAPCVPRRQRGRAHIVIRMHGRVLGSAEGGRGGGMWCAAWRLGGMG